MLLCLTVFVLTVSCTMMLNEAELCNQMSPCLTVFVLTVICTMMLKNYGQYKYGKETFDSYVILKPSITVLTCTINQRFNFCNFCENKKKECLQWFWPIQIDQRFMLPKI
jgi:hypothetical protein